MTRGGPLSLAATVLLPLACASCAATDEVVEFPSSSPADMQSSQRHIPVETAAALRACLTDGAARLQHHAYDLSFEVQVTPRGTIHAVELERGRLEDDDVKACMIQALKEMPLFGVVALDESLSLSSPSHLPAAPALLGTATVLPELIHLTPIVLTASGVTMVVAVGVIVLAAVAAGEMSKECQREWIQATEKCNELLRSNNPPRGVTGGYTDPRECARGLVSMRCGGNSVDPDGQPARPGRRT